LLLSLTLGDGLFLVENIVELFVGSWRNGSHWEAFGAVGAGVFVR